MNFENLKLVNRKLLLCPELPNQKLCCIAIMLECVLLTALTIHTFTIVHAIQTFFYLFRATLVVLRMQQICGRISMQSKLLPEPIPGTCTRDSKVTFNT